MDYCATQCGSNDQHQTIIPTWEKGGTIQPMNVCILVCPNTQVRDQIQQWWGRDGIFFWGSDGSYTKARVKITPQTPQWQRRMEAPLHTMMNVYGTLPQYKGEDKRLKPLWKSLTLTGPAGEWLGAVRYVPQRSSPVGYRCEVCYPQEYAQQFIDFWGEKWQAQKAEQIERTEALIQATQRTDHHWARTLKLVDIPEWHTGTAQGAQQWEVRYQYEFPWPIITKTIPVGHPLRAKYSAIEDTAAIAASLRDAVTEAQQHRAQALAPVQAPAQAKPPPPGFGPPTVAPGAAPDGTGVHPSVAGSS